MRKIVLVMVAVIFALAGCESTKADKDHAVIPTETIALSDGSKAKVAEPENGTTENMAGIWDALNELDYKPYTCDGLPEYRLTSADGTAYAINFSEKWVWRGNREQAGLSDEVIAQLKECSSLVAASDQPSEVP